jgi:hypothetical protein
VNVREPADNILMNPHYVIWGVNCLEFVCEFMIWGDSAAELQGAYRVKIA